ncbi:LysR family transcriptional regulator [Aquamicrobium sp. LC103]|uniref:LysR family transcriptional regulator n=1 Tax=Aquamicrobium sp. LC103 TaxID=1120658 RepID=UPI00063EA3DE|nr:LysR family transcriptional regulator [Aquamicrobium sp. LC103]TKT75731.1 LysR family transcriptional regulator [Aquamicrobium sp. LC103]
MLLPNLSRIDLNLLHVFVVIYQESSITRAAEALNLSQPAVSNSVARLRDLLGDPLFVRAGNGVAPTPLAQRLIVPVRQALSTLEHAFGEHETFDPATSQRILRFSMSDFAEAVLLAPLIGEISSAGSPMEVENFYVPERELHSRLASGELDFAIEFRPPSEPNLRRLLLMEDEFVCVMRLGHPALQGDLTLDAYLRLEHLHIFNRPRFSNLVDSALAATRQRRRVSARIEHCLGVRSILEVSDLCVTIPRVFVERFLPPDAFTVRPIPFEMGPLATWLFWHPATERSPAHCWVKDAIQRLTASRDEPA